MEFNVLNVVNGRNGGKPRAVFGQGGVAHAQEQRKPT